MPALVLKSPRERLAELVGSLLGSALAAAAMCVVMLLVESYRGHGREPARPEQFAWLLLVSMAGTWAVLSPAKFWEGVRGDPMLRRFLLMVVGMGVGAVGVRAVAVAYGRSAAGGRLPDAARLPAAAEFLRRRRPAADDGPRGLFRHIVPRWCGWWRQADPLRRRG